MAKKISSTKNEAKKQRSVRFRPDPLTVAYISFKNEKPFQPNLVALVLNESYSGCSVLLNTDNPIKKDQKLNIKVGQLAPMSATIVWFKNLEESIYKIGIKFLE